LPTGGTAIIRLRRIAFRLGGFVLAGAFYLLLIDTTDLPELYVGIAAAVIAALAFEVSREQGFAEVSLSPLWLRGAWRLLERVPVDAVRVGAAAVAQLVRPRRARGRLHAIPFDACADEPRDAGRRALAEALGSLPPNTIVIGIDTERGLLLAHQLAPGGRPQDIDVLRLG
jgi:hypothetical protein